MKKLLKRLLLGGLLLLVVSYGLLQTSPAKQWLAGFISRQLSTQAQQVQITRIRGHIPWEVNIEKLAIKNEANDDVLVIDEIALDWRLLRLLKGQMVINSLKAKHIEWLRPFPKQANTTTKQPLQSLPLFAIGEVALPEIIIAKGLAGAEALHLQLAINGDKNQMMNFKGQLVVKQGINTELLFNFAPNSRSSFLLDIALNEAEGGLVGSLLKLPAKQSIHMKALLTGDLQSLDGGFNLRLGDELLADLSIKTDYANHVQLVGGGALPDFVKLPKIITSRDWQINASINHQADLWQIEAAKMRLANIELDLSGEVSRTNAKLKPHFSVMVDEQQYEAEGDVAVDFVAQNLQATMQGELPNLPQTHPWLGEKASIKWQAKANGAFTSPQLELAAKATKITPPPQLAHLKLGEKANFNATMNGTKLQAEMVAGELNLNMGATLKKRINANIELIRQNLPTINADLTLKGAMIEAMKIVVAETIFEATKLQPSKQAGKITISSDDIAPLAAWFGLAQASGAINAVADIAAQTASLQASKLMLPQYDVSISKLDGAVQKGGGFTLATQGEHAGEKIALNAAGNYAKQQANLQQFEGEYGEHNFTLAKPTSITWNKGNWQLPPTIMQIAGATLNMHGKQSNNKVDIALEIPNMALRPLLQDRIPTMGEANLTARANITGNPKSPEMAFDASLTANEMSKLDKDNTLPQQISLKLQGKYTGEKLGANASLTSGAEQLGGGKLALPLEFSLQPFALRLPAKPMQADGYLEVAMSRFNSWLSPLGHRLKANLLANFSASGNALKPITKAKIAFNDFNYTNLTSGICLRHGTMQAQLNEQNQFVLQSFAAKGDRDKGEVSASGVADFAADSINFNMNTKDAAIFCSPMLDSSISGDLKLAGTKQALKLTGKMQLGKTSILVPSGGKTSIPKVEKIYRHEMARKQEMARMTTTNSKPQTSPIALDLSIDAPARVFVRGRGLDAEFGGNFEISGNANAPKINGKLASRRGRLALLGSTMQINEGIIRFMNGLPQKPYIQLQGSTKTNNTQINVELEGAVLKPKLKLSSTPSLPQDEILALLLFGKPLDKISPFQALQLAQAAASLASGESGTGMLGSAREVLGVDSLNVGEGADGSPTIGAGKYVTDKVFVGIEQGTTPESRRISTEIELSPTVTGKTSTNSQGEPTLGLEWRYDY